MILSFSNDLFILFVLLIEILAVSNPMKKKKKKRGDELVAASLLRNHR